MIFEITKEFIGEKEFRILRPSKPMTDAEYNEIKPWIENIGGHWRERVKGFTFDGDLDIRNKVSKWREDNQFFPTPKQVAKRVVQVSGLIEENKDKRIKVLEPSAGHGALLDEIPKSLDIDFYIVEPYNENVSVLDDKGYDAYEMNFETFSRLHKNEKGTFDYVLMNPPFSKSRDVLHTMTAYKFLKPDGILVAVISENALYYENDESKKFRDWLKSVDYTIEDVPYGLFKESGTTVDTVIIKVVKHDK